MLTPAFLPPPTHPGPDPRRCGLRLHLITDGGSEPPDVLRARVHKLLTKINIQARGRTLPATTPPFHTSSLTPTCRG